MMRTMRDSGIEWIGEIPITWDARRTKELFGTLSGNGLSTDLQADDGIPFYKAGDISACDKFLEVAKSFVDFSIAEKRSFNIIPAMSIVFAKIGEAMKKNSRAITTIECCIDNNCQALIPKSIDLGFAYYLLLCIDMRWFDNAGTLPCVSVYKLMQSLMPYPPLAEQKKIADFLDGKCAEIDELVQTEEKMIEELKAYKQSVITEAVTKGLNPSAPMKDSGIEWIGKIPASWEVGRMKYVADINAPCKDVKQYERISYAPMECIKRGWMECQEISPLESSSGLTKFEENDIVMAKVTPCFENGNIAVAKDLINGVALGSSELFVFRARTVLTEWLFYFLQNSKFTDLAKSTMVGTGGLKRVSPKFVSNYQMGVPSLDEQKQIADYLDEKCAKIDEIIALRTEQINQLKEYKKSLIYEYVTGKKEVV